MKEIKISKNEQNQRLDKFLLKYFNTAPKSFVYKMLRKKRIKYNQKKAEGGEIIQEGDLLTFYLAEETMASFMEAKEIEPCPRRFGIVYEDENILAVSKPAGLLSQREKSDEKDTLVDQIVYYLYEKGDYTPSAESVFTPAICNRLDRNTSGIVLAGKNLAAVQQLNQAIAAKQLAKYYIALVKGRISESGELSGFLKKDGLKNQSAFSKTKTEGADEIKTIYRPIRHTEDYTLLELQLITGKSHQIRAHMKSIGHPVAGDRKYGDEQANIFFRRNFALSNQFLHAWRVKFHFQDGLLAYLDGKEITAPLPKQLQNIINDLFQTEAIELLDGFKQNE